MAVTGAARVVGVGSGAAGAAVDVGAMALALEAAGVPVSSRTLVDPDEAGLEQALAPGAPLTVIVAGADGSEGDLLRRVVARVTGTRLVLNDRALALLESRHHRIDRPLPRAAERQALLPQGAVVWETASGAAGVGGGERSGDLRRPPAWRRRASDDRPGPRAVRAAAVGRTRDDPRPRAAHGRSHRRGDRGTAW